MIKLKNNNNNKLNNNNNHLFILKVKKKARSRYVFIIHHRHMLSQVYNDYHLLIFRGIFKYHLFVPLCFSLISLSNYSNCLVFLVFMRVCRTSINSTVYLFQERVHNFFLIRMRQAQPTRIIRKIYRYSVILIMMV